MPDLLLNKLKAIAKVIGISRDKSISRRILLRFLNESQLEKESERILMVQLQKISGKTLMN